MFHNEVQLGAVFANTLLELFEFGRSKFGLLELRFGDLGQLLPHVTIVCGFKSYELVLICSFEENLDKKAFGGPKGYAKETARCKALDVCSALKQKLIVPDLIISADTVCPHSFWTLRFSLRCQGIVSGSECVQRTEQS